MLFRLFDTVVADQGFQIGKAAAEPAAKVDNALVRDGAVAGALRSLESSEFHRLLSPKVLPSSDSRRMRENTVLPPLSKALQVCPPGISTKRFSGSSAASSRASLISGSSVPQTSHTRRARSGRCAQPFTIFQTWRW